jgi:7,8-dihydroneopterin aldolase/epimerase/oxygenase
VRDSVFVEGLEASTIIGVHAHERQAPQRVLVDVELACDTTRAAANDDLAQAVDYDALVRSVLRHVAQLTPRLLETLGEELARRLQAEFHAPWIRLRLVKPGVLPQARAVGIVLERGRRPGSGARP